MSPDLPLLTPASKNANVSDVTPSSARVATVYFVERLAPGRSRNMLPQTAGVLSPNSIYRLHTNARYPYAYRPGDLFVQASDALWNISGLMIQRIGATPELFFDVRVAERVPFDPTVFVFDVRLMTNYFAAPAVLPASVVAVDASVRTIAGGKEQRMGELPVAGQAAAAPRKVDETRVPTPAEHKSFWDSVPAGGAKPEPSSTPIVIIDA